MPGKNNSNTNNNQPDTRNNISASPASALGGVYDRYTGDKVTDQSIRFWRVCEGANNEPLPFKHFGLFAGTSESRLYNPDTKGPLEPWEREAGICGVTKATRDQMVANGGQIPNRNRWNSALEVEAIERDIAISKTLYQELSDSDMDTQFDPESDREFDSDASDTEFDSDKSDIELGSGTKFDPEELLGFLNGSKSKFDPVLNETQDGVPENNSTGSLFSNTR